MMFYQSLKLIKQNTTWVLETRVLDRSQAEFEH